MEEIFNKFFQVPKVSSGTGLLWLVMAYLIPGTAQMIAGMVHCHLPSFIYGVCIFVSLNLIYWIAFILAVFTFGAGAIFCIFLFFPYFWSFHWVN
jgi:hypothetical protein